MAAPQPQGTAERSFAHVLEGIPDRSQQHHTNRPSFSCEQLDRFATEMYLNNFGAAFYFVRSAEHDIIDMHRLAHDAKGKSVTTLVRTFRALRFFRFSSSLCIRIVVSLCCV